MPKSQKKKGRSRRPAAGEATGAGDGSTQSRDEDQAKAAFLGQVLDETDRRLAERSTGFRAPSKVYLYAGVCALLVAYVLQPGDFKPNSIRLGSPVDWSGSLDPATHQISNVERIHPKLLHSPDQFVITSEDVMYFGTIEGAIWKWTQSQQPVVIAHIGNESCVYPTQGTQCGRPLIMTISEDEQTLYVTDVHYGLSAISLPAGHVTRLLSVGQLVQEGEPRITLLKGVYRVGDHLYLGEPWTEWDCDGNIAASFSAHDDGRILQYNTKTDKVRVFAKGLYFPSGLSQTRDGRYLIVTELTRARLVWLNLATGKVVKTSGPMPGLPDVITAHPGHGGGHLVSIEVVRNAMVDYMAENKWFKRVLYKLLPKSVLLRFQDDYNLCVHITDTSTAAHQDESSNQGDDVIDESPDLGGDIVDSWHASRGRVVSAVLQCRVHGDYMYFTSRKPDSALSRVKLRHSHVKRKPGK
ncbi:adipocyte plasma membrane-associated protein-like [Sycon ciliatum]|uniref:adipocyte plasma membrane-associated protein-like n=1 Tax=Sycon ciliatum TaxID=27933 RepID=UPI0031F71468